MPAGNGPHNALQRVIEAVRSGHGLAAASRPTGDYGLEIGGDRGRVSQKPGAAFAVQVKWATATAEPRRISWAGR